MPAAIVGLEIAGFALSAIVTILFVGYFCSCCSDEDDGLPDRFVHNPDEPCKREGWMQIREKSEWKRHYFRLVGLALYKYDSEKKRKLCETISVAQCTTTIYNEEEDAEEEDSTELLSGQHRFKISSYASDPKPPNRYFDCESDKEKFEWMEAIGSAPLRKEQTCTIEDCYTVLSLTEPCSKRVITKKYHQLALQQHPDKGGSPAIFDQTTKAYQALISRYDLLEEYEADYVRIKVVLYPESSGLGIELEQKGDSPNAQLVITLLISGRAAAKSGAVKAGDILVGVQGVDITTLVLDDVFQMLLRMGQEGAEEIEVEVVRKEADDTDQEDIGDGSNEGIRIRRPPAAAEVEMVDMGVRWQPGAGDDQDSRARAASWETPGGD
jgi:hypothetical protein